MKNSIRKKKRLSLEGERPGRMLIVLVHQVKTFADRTRMRWTVGRVGSAERKRQRGGGIYGFYKRTI